MAPPKYRRFRGQPLYAEMLPFAVWQRIVRIAITEPWDQKEKFMPPADVRGPITGFARSTPFFGQVSVSVLSESVCYDSAYQLLTQPRKDPSAIRHLDLDFERGFSSQVDGVNTEEHLAEKTFLELSKYNKLESFVATGFLLKNMDKVPSASRLVRLDCGIFGYPVPWQSLDLSAFTRLEELRLRSVECIEMPYNGGFCLESDEVEFANTLATVLAPLARLRLLSVRKYVSPDRTYTAAVDRHEATCVPSLFVACEVCKKRYGDARVVRAENTVTRILAERVPTLRRVLWANAWVWRWHDEKGQRGTDIVREPDGEGVKIVLIRDDGVKVKYL